MKKNIFIIIAVCLLVAIIAFAINSNKQNTAPQFNSTNIINKQIINEKNFLDKITILNFWYPSCPGCVQEMPQLIAFHQQYSKLPNFQTIAISLNLNTENEVIDYTQKYKLPFIVSYDTDGSVAKAYDVVLAPTTFLIDEQGNIVRRYLGEPDWQELKAYIEKQ
ncbi:MAG: TlpA family protein disulfide reductase [Neisseriaceae bacterium]|nr:TlpA family protein disulfide reductase [Neisseriaceae bacterium]